MIQRIPHLILVSLILFILLIGCIIPQPPVPAPPYKSVNTLTDAHNELGFKMLHELTKKDSGKNVFISPTSISLALTMVYDGSVGSTKDGIANTLEFQNLSQDTIDNDSNYLIQSLSTRQNVELSVANSIWLNNDLQLNPDYKTNMEQYLDARVSTLDFNLPTSADTINSWVSDKTHNKITSIIDPPLNNYKAILVNAVYFKGKWKKPFNVDATHDKNFTAGDGSVSSVPMMEQSGEYNYLENDKFQAIELPYSDNLSMFVFLPKISILSNQKIEDFVQDIDSVKWGQWRSQFEQDGGTILLPRFKTTYSTTLNEPLQNFGMGVAFSDSADFSPMSSTPLKIDTVIHKTFVETNEEGTEAAAVTGVIMDGTTAADPPSKPPFYMKVDHPFFFAIYDEQTGSILFMGTMNDV
ncbi:MAG: serpin family protein [Candidatus Micrarchaeota archaeon]